MPKPLSQLSGCPSVERFLDRCRAKGLAKVTVSVWLLGVRALCEALGCSPDEAVERIRKGELAPSEALERLSLALVDKVSRNTLRNYLQGARSFLVANGVPKEAFEDFEGPKVWISHVDRVPSRDELRLLLMNADARGKAMVAFMASSGVRINTLCELKLGDVDLSAEIPSVRVPPASEKERRGYTTFATPEAKRFLIAYLSQREDRGEELAPKSPLFAGRSGGKLTHAAVWQILDRLFRKSGLKVRERGADQRRLRYEIHPYVLRKWFKTRLEAAGLGRAFVEYFMGHRPAYLDASYFRPSLEDLRREYAKAVPELTIMSDVAAEEYRKRQLLDMARLLGFPEERLRKLQEVLARARSVDEAIDQFRRLREEGGNPRGSGRNCALIARSEEELLERLEEGWDFVKELSGGRYLLRRFAP